ncbi:hypothetical protein HanIR_Chr14g0691561 [Helianthus annuus]|nr:hypothetical protein HanIR_Chr14g0691561 [Helianthus annuus]
MSYLFSIFVLSFDPPLQLYQWLLILSSMTKRLELDLFFLRENTNKNYKNCCYKN